MKKYMCLGCGKFWRSEVELQPTQNYCPYCRDMYWTFNILDEVPPPLSEETDFFLTCGHSVRVDLTGDLKFCCVCGEPVEGERAGLTQIEWQEQQLERLGL